MHASNDKQTDVTHLALCCCVHACRYGGVVVRQNVAAKADWYIMDIQQMIDALEQQ